MKQGNQFHIESFFKENYSRLFYFAYKIVEDRAAAEDVVQDVFLKSTEYLSKFSGIPFFRKNIPDHSDACYPDKLRRKGQS